MPKTKMSYWCAVKDCKNTSLKTPNKMWIPVPTEINLRKTWLKLARRNSELVPKKNNMFFCEDHFDLENDMLNYMEYKIMGLVNSIRLKPFCKPCKFNWNVNSNESQFPVQDLTGTNIKVSSSCIEGSQTPAHVSSMENKCAKPVQIIHVQSHTAKQLEKDMENYMQHKLRKIPGEKIILRVKKSDIIPHVFQYQKTQKSIQLQSNAADPSTTNAQDVERIAVKVEESTEDSDVTLKADLAVNLDSQQVSSEQCNEAIKDSSKNTGKRKRKSPRMKEHLADCEAYFKSYREELKKTDQRNLYRTSRDPESYLKNLVSLDKGKCNELLSKKSEYINKDKKLADNSDNSKTHGAATLVASEPAQACPGPTTRVISQMKQSNRALMFLEECENDSESKSTETKFLEHPPSSGLSANTEVTTELPCPDSCQCIECNGIISGFVFACVQCGVRACAACAARGTHARHYVLRAPSGTPHSELELVISKIREALSSTQLLPQEPPPRVPEVELETEMNDVIKMEFKTEEEEEEYQDLYNDFPSTSTAKQPCEFAWEPLEVCEETSAPQREDDQLSTTSSTTLTATDPWDISSTDSEEDESLVNHPTLTWTPNMNKRLVTLHMHISKVENRRSELYSRMKQAFAISFPNIKVTKSQLEAQRKIIFRKKLLTEQDIDSIANDTSLFDHFKSTRNKINDPIITSTKGTSLVLSKVTSGDARSQIENSNVKCSTKTLNSHVNKAKGNLKQSKIVKKNDKGQGKTKRKGKAKYKSKAKKFKVLQPAEGASGVEVSLPPGRGGRERKVPVRLRT